MNGRRIVGLVVCVVLGLSALAGLFILTGHAAGASGVNRHVAKTGSDINPDDCTNPALPCLTIQHALGVAGDDDIIKVAAGVYSDVNSYGGLAQVVYLTKTLTLRGGYTTTNWIIADPVANPTTLDAEGQGRVLYIAGPIAPTIEGLRMTGGDASGRGGGSGSIDAGGGVFVTQASPTISNCVVYGNTASAAGQAYGGGLYLYQSAAILSSNIITGNTAGTSTAGNGFGGGVYLDYSDDATLSDNLVEGNTASTASHGHGGGVYLLWSDATLDGNTILGNVGSKAMTSTGGGLVVRLSAATLTGNSVLSNTAAIADRGYGGGMSVGQGPAILTGNTVRGNIASAANTGQGGGIHLVASQATLKDNTITANVANSGQTSRGEGGGLTVLQGSAVLLEGNTIQGNAAATVQTGLGGGLLVDESDLTLTGNQLITNVATLNPGAGGSGGGLYAGVGTSITLTNNVVAGNQANTSGDGLLFNGTSGQPTAGRLLHTTIADNSGSGRGVSVANFTTLALTNTIIAGHHGYGIWVGASTTVTLQATLWYGNGTDTGGTGTIDTGTVNVYDDPAFVDPSTWDYHLTSTSAAIDEGVNAGVTVDMDGESRPFGADYDIGADEYVAWQLYLPLVLRGW